MSENKNGPSENYRIEVSGWGLDNTFFVEQTDLLWSEDGGKRLALRHSLVSGAMVVVRLIGNETSTVSSIPVTYQVDRVQPMGCNGLCEMDLKRLEPRPQKESNPVQVASNLHEEPQDIREASGSPNARELEEILQ